MTTVLMVLTSNDRLGETGRPTGWNLEEAAQPWTVFKAAGWDVEFASPQGGRAPLDVEHADPSDPVQAEFLEEFGDWGPETLRPDQVDPQRYDVIFYVGGHGTMWDLPEEPQLAGVAADVWDRGGIVSAVCHGPAGLVGVRLADGTPLVAGKRVAAFTDEEEEAAGMADAVPFLLASKLAELGAVHEPAPNWAAQVVVDGRLATGQNPASARPLAEAIVAARSRLVTS